VLQTISLLIAGLSTGQKLGIAAAGFVFIAFALICSLVIPKRNPSFPGRHMGWYIVVVALFVIGMLAAVLTLGKEKPEASAATPPSTTTSTTTSTTGTATGPTVQGDPVAGKHVFLTAGCTSCHTLKAAGSTGTVGPNLDQLKPAEAKVVHQVTVGGGVMPSFKSQLTPAQIQDVAAFVYTSTH
jgi:mono/diheme cytochrome c family protein